ncbi:unnamed protein product [Schistosoma mattheei]|uniref:Uncharacterized protein n=1 Tax=Schistosoma mattheei TaxID=31246 RepID=A0AA85BP51_9TREM|nr:unnamed protein product [Schistosoma mattheei]
MSIPHLLNGWLTTYNNQSLQCRILEYEQKVKIKGKTSKVEVELWDASGDKKYETCWPAIFKGCHGVVFVYNPDNLNHVNDLQNWYRAVPPILGLGQQQMCIICHKKPDTSIRDPVSLRKTNTCKITCYL